jgi:hypothetical protein
MQDQEKCTPDDDFCVRTRGQRGLPLAPRSTSMPSSRSSSFALLDRHDSPAPLNPKHWLSAAWVHSPLPSKNKWRERALRLPKTEQRATTYQAHSPCATPASRSNRAHVDEQRNEYLHAVRNHLPPQSALTTARSSDGSKPAQTSIRVPMTTASANSNGSRSRARARPTAGHARGSVARRNLSFLRPPPDRATRAPSRPNRLDHVRNESHRTAHLRRTPPPSLRSRATQNPLQPIRFPCAHAHHGGPRRRSVTVALVQRIP